MIESFKEIPFDTVKEIEDMDKLLQEKLGIGFAECGEALSQSVLNRTEELVENLPNIAPYGDYDLLMEDKEAMTKFLKEEAAQAKNWDIQFVEVRKDKDQLMELVFFNKAVDGGDVLKGFVFIGLSGKIRHAFAQVNA